MEHPVRPQLLLLCLIAAGAIFALDTMIGPHVAAGIAYVALILLSWRSRWSALALWLAALVTALMVLAVVVSPARFSTLDLADRGLVVLVIWLTAFVCSRLIATANKLDKTRGKLEQQRDAAKTTVDQAATALISERKVRIRIKDELKEAELRYRAVFNQTFQLLAVLRPSGALEEANATLRGLGPVRSESTTGMPIWDLPFWDSEGRDRLRSAVASAGSGDFFRDEFRIRRSNGDDMIVDLSLKPVRNSSGHIDLIILEARDITQHKRDQAQLMQAQKMEVLGQFASGIAHDFNNLLTVIGGNLELVQRRTKADASVSRRIDKALKAVFQGRSLTDRILTFARKQQLAPRPLDLHSFILEAIDLASSGLEDNITTETRIAPDLWPCWADPAQLQIALLNLVINSRDAMPNGGRITVRACNFTLRPGHQGERPDLPEGDYVRLSVIDDGAGIPAEMLEKVTDPFFTTKGPGGGSGLGLSMVHGFAKQSDGDLVLASTEGQGTAVDLYLPRSSQPAHPPPLHREVPEARGDHRVLVVEDEPEVRDAAVSVLSDLGYRVQEASSSAEALALLREGARVDLLVTDIMLPDEGDGGELGRLARSILPDLKILYSSADPQKVAEIRALQGSHEDFLPKPYHYAELARKAERLLSRENRAG